MSGGVTKANRVKLSQLRGKGAQAALDARKLAETAILTAMKDKEVRSTIHIPSVIPEDVSQLMNCLLYTSPSPRDLSTSRMPSSA